MSGTATGQGRAFPARPTRFCVADVGSTTTKAVLFVKDRAWRYVRAESPTTVEKPYEDVTVGLVRALEGLERATGETLLRDGEPAIPLLATSSAGGGLAMVVLGLVRDITARSADRAALGAGAIVLDVLALDDGRRPYRKIEDLKSLRPDMILLAGGFDADNITGPAFLAELISEAGLVPKLTPGARLPVVFAGNVNARDAVKTVLGERFLVQCVDNLRPDEGTENPEPCRRAIHALFMDHVMSHAPGYQRLTEWVAAPVLPTPAAFARTVEHVSRSVAGRVLAVDIGGATTDVFTAEAGRSARTVSANLGMSYSILNVLAKAGSGAVLDVLGEEVDPKALWNRVGEKHAHPTSLPATPLDMRIEWAVAAVALREAVREHHAALRTAEPPVLDRQDVNDLLRERPIRTEPRPPVRLDGVSLVVGSGGILSHSPPPAAARVLAAGLAPPGQAVLAADRDFLFPHLGAVAAAAPDLATELIEALGVLAGAGEGAAAAPWPAAWVPPPRPEEPREAMRSGPLVLARELAIPGTVLVAPGDAAATDTVVARSTRQFLRPFFLKAAAALEIRPEDLAAHLTRKPGDAIEVDEVLATRPRHLGFPKTFRSPVAGIFERILPGGVLLLREKPETAREYTTVQAARDLDVDPRRLKAHLRVAPGDEVERGQWLAAVITPRRQRYSVSPVRGRVNRIDHAFGMVVIEPLLEQLEVRAFLPGTVESVNDRGARIGGEAAVITGVWGRGGETSGTLDFGAPGPGRVLVTGYAGAACLAAVEAAGGPGVICAGMDIADVLDPEPGFTLVVAEGFGARRFAPATLSRLEAHAGRLALIDGTTRLRVGVRRPVVILPTAGG